MTTTSTQICSICSQKLPNNYTQSTVKLDGKSVVLRFCNACEDLTETYCTNCNALLKIGTKELVFTRTISQPGKLNTINLCRTCNGIGRTYCSGQCGTVLDIGSKSIAASSSYTIDRVVIAQLCDSCKSANPVWCAGFCGTLLKVGTKELAQSTPVRDPALKQGPSASLCSSCTSAKQLWCSGQCGKLLRIDSKSGKRQIEEFRVLKDGKDVERAWFCTDCNNRKPLLCIGNCYTVLGVGNREVAHSTPIFNPLLKKNMEEKLCDACLTFPLKWCPGPCGRLIGVAGKTTNIAAKMCSTYWGEYSYCVDCCIGAKACVLCGLPAANSNGKAFPGAELRKCENDYRCSVCSSSRVPEKSAKDCFDRVYGWLGSLGLSFEKPDLVIAKQEIIQERTKNLDTTEKGTHTYGVTSYVAPSTSGAKPKSIIYIDDLLSPMHFMLVVAHELAHAWQNEKQILPILEKGKTMLPSEYRAILKARLQFKEGFAEWITYKCLHALVSKEELGQKQTLVEFQVREGKLRGNTDQIYGDGMRYFLKMEREKGLQKVIETIQAVQPTVVQTISATTFNYN